MRRIYLESFAGLLILFALSMYAYQVIVLEMNPDYEYLLEEHKSAAVRNLLTELAVYEGHERTMDRLNEFVSHTAQTLETVNYGDLPASVKAYFDSEHREHANTFYDADRHLWMRLSDQSIFYHIHDDEATELRQAIAMDDNFLWGFIVAGFFCYSGALIWFLNRRVRKLERATLRFAEGDLSARAPEASKDRVGELNKCFNHMANKISNLITSNRSLTNAVAHDLRTPIFRIQWQAEILQDEELSDKQRSKIASIIEDTEEMEQMVNELLHFAKLERPETIIDRNSFDLNQELQNLINQRNDNVSLELNLHDGDCVITADQSLVKRAVSNLLSNAARYTQSKIAISTLCSDNSISIVIEDDGQGIDQKHWPYIFDAFYSADPSRHKASSGSGFGLAIVKSIAEKHHGQAKVETSPLGGAKFTLTLPKNSTGTDIH